MKYKIGILISIIVSFISFSSIFFADIDKANNNINYGMIFVFIILMGGVGGMIMTLFFIKGLEISNRKKELWEKMEHNCSYCETELDFNTFIASINYDVIECENCYEKNQRKALLSAINTLF